MTRTAKSARRKLALTLFSALAVIGVAGATLIYAASIQPDFRITATPTQQTVGQGQSAEYAIAIARDNSFSEPVALTASVLPNTSNTSVGFTPNPVLGSANESIVTIRTNVNGTTPTGNYQVTITGAGGDVTKSTTVSLTVVGQDQASFALNATPSSRVTAENDTESYSLAISRTGGFQGAVALSTSGLPNDVTGSFGTSNPVAGSQATFTVSAGHNPKPGDYAVLITGTGFQGTTQIKRTISVQLTVEEKKPLRISGDAPAGLAPGDSVPVDLVLSNPHNFELQVRDLAVAVDRNTGVPGCSGQQNFSVLQIPDTKYPLNLPANATRNLSQLGLTEPDEQPQIVMNDLPVNQDSCRGATLFLRHSGWATKQ